jgi:hypothetical protein
MEAFPVQISINLSDFIEFVWLESRLLCSSYAPNATTNHTFLDYPLTRPPGRSFSAGQANAMYQPNHPPQLEQSVASKARCFSQGNEMSSN